MALRREEREAHAAADEQPVDLGQQRLDDLELVADLGAAEHDDVGARRGPRSAGRSTSTSAATSGPAACGSRSATSYDAGVLAVHRAEGVVDVEVGERGEPVGERAALGVVLARLRRPRSGRSRAGRPARARAPSTTSWRRLPHDVLRPARTGAPSSSSSRSATGARLYAGSGAPFGRPRWAVTTTAAPAVEQVAQQRHAGPDAAVVGDPRRRRAGRSGRCGPGPACRATSRSAAVRT